MFNKMFLAALFVATAALAQDKAPPPVVTTSVFRLEYTITELDGAKKTGSHSYVLLVSDRQRGRMRIGSKVPVRTKEGQFNYLDVGVNLDAMPTLTDSGTVRLDTTCELSGLLSQATSSDGLPPVLRNSTMSLQTMVPLDKLVVLTTQDEPAGTSSVQIQVLVKLVK